MFHDLTAGKPDTVLRRFCLPLFGSVIFQQLYNIADSFVAGKFINENALAAVGNSYEITLIFIAFAFGCNIGCSVIVSKLFGSKKISDMKTAISTAIITSAVICAVLMLCGMIFSEPLLELIKTPSDIFYDSKIYLDIYIWGFPFVLFYNIANGIFSALGDSRTPFIFLACSSLSNIAVDILFVKVFRMGVAGIAWATFICQGISCVLALIIVFIRLRTLESDFKSALFSFNILLDISKVAIPSIIQQSCISVGNIMIQGIINGFGSGVIAGYSAAIKLNNLMITSLSTVANGVSNYTAQNIGAGKTERISQGYKASLRLTFAICIPVAVLYFAAGSGLVGFFIDEPTADSIHTATVFLRIISPFYLICAVKLMADGILRGAGCMKSFMVSTFTDLILRVVLAFTFSSIFGSTGIWCAWPLGWVAAAIISVFFCLRNPWMKHRNPKTRPV